MKTGPQTTGDSLSFEDAFVAKVKSDGTDFVYCGYIGAVGQNDEGHGIAVDDDGAAYVAGRSPNPARPTVPSAWYWSTVSERSPPAEAD